MPPKGTVGEYSWQIPEGEFVSRGMVQSVLRVLGAKESKRDYTLWFLFFRLGLRPGEAVQLTVGDVFDDEGQVRDVLRIRAEITKTKTARSIALPAEVRKQLQRYQGWKRKANKAGKRRHPGRMIDQEPTQPFVCPACYDAGEDLPGCGVCSGTGWVDPPLFVSRERGRWGEPRGLTVDQVGKMAKALRKQLDLPSWFTAHKGRHWLGTRLANPDPERETAGNPVAAQRILGHASLRTTMQAYVKVTPEQQREALRALDGVR